ncbi:ion channel [Egbenema bharatensis]|uniref:ion channel n=1 Tax=Egbenema bharatensis TaxID=3463334 RepID=UPI003A83F1A2
MPIPPHSSTRRSPARSNRNPSARLVNLKGGFNVVQLGSIHSRWNDLYHLLLTLPWLQFLGLLILTYIGLNGLFALAFLAGGPNSIANAQAGSFKDAFFFSVQTMASIGYGAMYPQTTYANIIVTLEAIVGVLWLAMATGLMFARFSRPTARVLFSQVAVIAPRNGIPTLMLRAANQRGNQILEAQLRLSLVRNIMTEEGEFMRRFFDLELERSQTPIFALTWLAMHTINDRSPLYGITLEAFAEMEAEIIVTLIGIDETFSQSIHARHSYVPSEILWNARFADILTRTPDGRRAVDYQHFHKAIPISPSHQPPNPSINV